MGISILKPVATTGTFAGTGTAAAAPLSNLHTLNPKEIWVASGANTSHYAQLDLGADMTIDTAALLFSNTPVSPNIGTHLVQFFNSSLVAVANSTVLPFMSGADPFTRRHAYHRFAAPIAGVRHVRITVAGNGNPAWLHSAGRFLCGLSVDLPAQWNVSRGIEPLRQEFIADDGTPIVYRGEGRPSLEFEALFSSQAAYESALWDFAQNSQEILVSYDAGNANSTRRLVYGFLDSRFSNEGPKKFRARCSIKGLI